MPEPSETFTYNRPETTDDATFSRIEFIRPVEQAAQPIIDHNVKLVHAVRELRPWYRGERDGFQSELLSTLLDPDANHACDMLESFIAVVKCYRPGEFPAHCCKMRELEFTTRYLMHELGKCFDSPAFMNAITHFGYLLFTWSAPNREAYTAADWASRLDTRLSRFVQSFADVAEACRLRERQRDAEIAFGAAPYATAEDVRAVADDVKRTIRRAKRNIIKDAHAKRESEADRRAPKGERGRQIAAVRKLVREGRANGNPPTILQACRKVWTAVKGGYPSDMALYDYCHSHESEF